MALESIQSPHPHVDPRQPRDHTKVRTNPPVFAWKPDRARENPRFRLQVATDSKLKQRVIDEKNLADPVFLPQHAMEPGTYFWRWTSGDHKSEIFSFKIVKGAVRLEVPPTHTWLESFSGKHPRLFFEEPSTEGVLESMKQNHPEAVEDLFQNADRLLEQRHHLPEPPFPPDRQLNYQKWREYFYNNMWGSRRFSNGAQALALAYALSGNKDYGKAAARRLASLAKWDPYGSTYLGTMDETHMSVIWYGPIACDWAWDCFTPKQRNAVVEQMKARARITFEHMHDRGQYGIERFDSHAGREIIFLALLLFVFHEFIPEAEAWLEWLRPILCGIWPIWADDDGSWAEGISYSLAYTSIMTQFASALKRRTGIDLYRRPFWKNYVRWREAMLPPYAEWIGFGDHSERWPEHWLRSANFIELVAAETNTAEFNPYLRWLREEAKTMTHSRPERKLVMISPHLFIPPPAQNAVSDTPKPETADPVLSVFKGAGWASIRSAPQLKEKDIAFIFRSSPYGSVSHSHANNNDFILHAAGTALLIPSGYYTGYASPHHAHWVWHTKSHNCITLSGATQLLRSPESRGELLSSLEDKNLAYILGNADESYQDQAEHCRRHVFFFKEYQILFLFDHFVARPGRVSSFQWNIHSFAKFRTNIRKKEFSLTRNKVKLTGKILYRKDAFFSLSEGWDPIFTRGSHNSDQWVHQYHLTYTPTPIEDKEVRFGVFLLPQAEHIHPPQPEIHHEDGIEYASFGDVAIEVYPPDSKAGKQNLATVRVGKRVYRIGPSGIKKLSGKA